MLNLFHATTFTRGEQILCDGKIKCDAPPLIKWIQATTPDWIYLSDRVDNAVHWGNKVSVLTRTEDFFCIFKIILPPDRCYPDLDDLLCNAGMINENANNTDLLTCLSVCHSCRTNSDLYFGVEVTHYTYMSTSRLRSTGIQKTNEISCSFIFDLIAACAAGLDKIRVSAPYFLHEL